MIVPVLAALLGCAPRYGDLPALTPDQLSSPLPVHHVTVDGVDVAYVDSGGSGPPVVFVHGLSSWLGFWDAQIRHYSGSYRVLALDLPGYGASGRPDAPCTPPWYAGVVDQWMAAVGVPHAVVVGHSMGGQIAMTLALDHPDRVDALVLSAPAGFETFAPGAARWMKDFWTEDRALKSSEEEVRMAFTQQVFARYDDHVEKLIEERVRMGRDPSFRGTSVAVSRSIAGMIDHPVIDRLDRIGVPTLIVFGTADAMIPNPVFTGGRTKTIAERGLQAIPDARLVMVTGAGHTVHHDAPEAFDDAMDAFLAEVLR